jgi:tmRNA-binding protein
MKDKNKEAIKILEENPLTNVYSPEDQIKMELMKAKDKKKYDERNRNTSKDPFKGTSIEGKD